jgi:hypothetical protein
LHRLHFKATLRATRVDDLRLERCVRLTELKPGWIVLNRVTPAKVSPRAFQMATYVRLILVIGSPRKVTSPPDANP